MQKALFRVGTAKEDEFEVPTTSTAEVHIEAKRWFRAVAIKENTKA
jgi:hypothetical protein